MNAALGVRRKSEPQQVAGEDDPGTISYVSARFWESAEFAEKSAATRSNYKYGAQVAREFMTHKGKGPALDKLYVDRLSLPVIQAIVETIAKGRQESAPGAGDEIVGSPSTANHLLRYFRVLFGWGMRHGHCKTNPAKGAKQVKERKRHGMPTLNAYNAVLNFARERGALQPHVKGSAPLYRWPLLENQIPLSNAQHRGRATHRSTRE